MANLTIDAEILQRLQEIAKQEKRPVNEVLRSMVEQYPEKSTTSTSVEALLAMDGMFDDDITDLSSITKEDVMEAYRKKYADTD